VNRPTLACNAYTGQKEYDGNAGSVCGGQGSSASCADNKPFSVAPRLSYAFTAAAVSGNHGLNGDENCGQCYEIKFTGRQHSWGGGSHPELVGKSMVVQVTNIGYDVNGEHSFDLQIPGAGQGLFDDGCTRQFGGSKGDYDCDNNYGGCNDRSGCARLPWELRSGCEWRFDWYRWLVGGGRSNNPWIDFRRVRCPAEITNISGSTPNDNDQYPAINPADYY